MILRVIEPEGNPVTQVVGFSVDQAFIVTEYSGIRHYVPLAGAVVVRAVTVVLEPLTGSVIESKQGVVPTRTV